MKTTPTNGQDSPPQPPPGGLPAILLEAFATGHVQDGQGQTVPLHSNVSLGEAQSLYRAVAKISPAVSAEVGMAQGVSTLAILQACADARKGVHHVMDPFQSHFGDAGLAMVARSGLQPWLQFHRKFAEEIIPSLPTLQFGFIDSSHLFDLTIAEFVLMDKKLAVGGLLAFHDTWMPSLQKFLRYVLANRAYVVVREFDAPAPAPPPKTHRPLLSWERVIRLIPHHERFLAPEMLQPWNEFALPNLIFLQKTAPDSRDWKFHHPF